MSNFPDLYTDSEYILSNDKRKRVCLNEKGHQVYYILNNKSDSRLIVYKVDGGIFKDSVSKCDFAIFVHDERHEKEVLFLVEIKGADLIKAINQLSISLDRLFERNRIDKCGLVVNARIALSKIQSPALNSSAEKKLKKKLKELYNNGTLEYKTQKFEETI